MNEKTKNYGKSIRSKLLNVSKQEGLFYQTVLTRYHPNTCCHKVLLLMMILISAFIYFCNTDFLLFPCVLIVAIATK